MKRLFLFNPENDIALASGKAGFTPPKNAAELHRRGAMLLWWLGDSGDGVLVDERDFEAAERFGAEAGNLFGAGPEVVADARGCDVGEPVPWGWSANALRLFENGGCAVAREEHDRMDRLRMLSHRRSSVEINRRLADAAIGMFPPLPKEIDSPAELEAAIKEWGAVYVKAPWSSTGRGVICSEGISTDELLRRSEGTMRRQGSVLVEKALDKVVDFAMLFKSGSGNVAFEGYSLFFNGRGSAYGGNLLLPDEEIERRLAEFVPRELLRRVAETLRDILSELVGQDYRGRFGVDMMICRDHSGGYMLAPCVELNLRLTMGVVAHRLTERIERFRDKKLIVAPANIVPDGAFWLVPRNDSYFIGIV